ncbi:MAG: hypothetical protein KKH11_04270 [Candidatus Omnitrophica bacterium]|nr:hypothetical protein [Candidatus Omnitrophota bacterium]
MKKHKNKKAIMEKLTTLSKMAAFDAQFWQKQGSQVRFAALWKAIEESYKLRGKSGHKLRLQRNIQHFEHI